MKNNAATKVEKIRMWMRGKNGTHIAKYYKTISPMQFAQIISFLNPPERSSLLK